MKFILHAFFIILLALVTFFGLGPILYADGVLQERILTAVVVIVIYVLIIFIYRKAIRWVSKK